MGYIKCYAVTVPMPLSMFKAVEQAERLAELLDGSGMIGINPTDGVNNVLFRTRPEAVKWCGILKNNGIHFAKVSNREAMVNERCLEDEYQEKLKEVERKVIEDDMSIIKQSRENDKRFNSVKHENDNLRQEISQIKASVSELQAKIKSMTERESTLRNHYAKELNSKDAIIGKLERKIKELENELNDK